MEETLKEVKEGTKFTEVKYFLFNDLLLRAKPKTLGEGFILKSQIPVESLLVKDPDDASMYVFLKVLTLRLFYHS